MRRRLFAVLLVCVFIGAGNIGIAADFPDKPVRFIVPFPPGGGTDALARILAGKLTEYWGQQVIIDNRAGAQGGAGHRARRQGRGRRLHVLVGSLRPVRW